MRWTVLVIILFSLVACGQKGDLTLPEKTSWDKPFQENPAQIKLSGKQPTYLFN